MVAFRALFVRRLAGLVTLGVALTPVACAGDHDSAPLDPAAAPDAPEASESAILGAAFDARELPFGGVREDDVVHLGDLAVVVPRAGESVGLVVHYDDGTTKELVVAHDDSGNVVAPVTQGEPLQLESASASPRACRDGAFHLEGFSWKTPYAWHFRAGSTPSTNAASQVELALRESVANITGSHNDCGLTDLVSAQATYLGRTSRAINVLGTATSIACGKRDGVNVVGFGVLPRGTLGLTCYWFSGSSGVEADVKLNDAHYAWFAKGAVPAGCRNAFSVEAVATHEFGHAFGLAHVSEATHGNLTMSTATGPCTSAPSTLGLGDVRGLRALY